jgi:hypothetical protein
LGRDIANLGRRPEFGSSLFGLELHSMCKHGSGVFDPGRLERPPQVLDKFGQLGGRKVRRAGGAKGTKALAEKLFPIYMIGCPEQPEDVGQGDAFRYQRGQRGVAGDDICINTHDRTS